MPNEKIMDGENRLLNFSGNNGQQRVYISKTLQRYDEAMNSIASIGNGSLQMLGNNHEIIVEENEGTSESPNVASVNQATEW